MVPCRYSQLLLVAAAIAIFHPVSAEPPAAVPAAAKEFLEAHNEARASVGVQPLRWSEQMANTTGRLVRYQRDRMACQFANLTAGKYGANQLLARGEAVTPRMAVEEWVKQRPVLQPHGQHVRPEPQVRRLYSGGLEEVP